jgi:hypothetical protein
MSHTHTHTHKLQLSHTHIGRGILWLGFVCVGVCVCVCVCFQQCVWVCGCVGVWVRISSEVPFDLDLSRRLQYISLSIYQVGRCDLCIACNSIFIRYIVHSLCVLRLENLEFFEKGISNWYKGLGLFQISSKSADD